jgi:hypothetical protein
VAGPDGEVTGELSTGVTGTVALPVRLPDVGKLVCARNSVTDVVSLADCRIDSTIRTWNLIAGYQIIARDTARSAAPR